MRKIKHQCPFCGEWVVHWNTCNGFCKCFAKYYSFDNIWLDRHSNKIHKGTRNLEYVEEK